MEEKYDEKPHAKSDLRFSDKRNEPAPIVNIPDLLCETDRRVKYEEDIEITREVRKRIRSYSMELMSL